MSKHPKAMIRPPAAPITIVASLPCDLRAPARARRCVQAVVAGSQLSEETQAELVLIASELVTNAIVHGAEPVTLTVTYDATHITVEVADGDPRADLVRMHDTDESFGYGGRGLRLVAALTEAWGVRTETSSKTVWATTKVDAPNTMAPMTPMSLAQAGLLD